MNTKALYERIRIRDVLLPAVETVKKASAIACRVFSFSLADGAVFPRRGIFAAIDAGSVSIACGRRFLSRIKIEKYRQYASAEGGYPSPEFFAERVAAFVGECRATRAPIVFSIPKAWAVVRTADLPAVAKESLADVVSYELDRLTPLTADRAYYDYRLIEERDGRICVGVAAARCELVKEYIDALAARGLPAERLTVHPEATANLLRSLYGGADAVYLRIGEKDYEIGHVAGGSVSRCFTGGFDMEDENARIGKIATETKALMGRLGKRGMPPGLCAAFLNGMDRGKMAAAIPLPIRIVGEADIARRFPLEMRGISPLVLGGLLGCLRPEIGKWNLLSKGRRKPGGAPFLVTGILLSAIAVLGLAYAAAPLQIEKMKLQEVERQILLRKNDIKKIESLQKELDALKGQIDTVTNFRTKNPTALTVIKELTTIMPKTSWLSRVRISESTVDIEGFATALPAEFLQKIEASNLFEKVEIAAPTVRDAAMKADRFVMKMERKGAGKEKKNGGGNGKN